MLLDWLIFVGKIHFEIEMHFLYFEPIFFLEVNTVPGQSAESIVPQQVRAMGMTTMELYGLLIETTLARN